jgi:hypothetical protein
VNRRRALALLAATVLALLAAPACRPLYLPPVPASLPPFGQELRLAEVRIERAAGAVRLAFVPEQVPADGWAAVQWFPPAGGEVASSSVWLDAGTIGRTLRVPFPADVARDRPGRWRAVLSFDGRVVRQLEWSEPAGP